MLILAAGFYGAALGWSALMGAAACYSAFVIDDDTPLHPARLVLHGVLLACLIACGTLSIAIFDVMSRYEEINQVGGYYHEPAPAPASTDRNI